MKEARCPTSALLLFTALLLLLLPARAASEPKDAWGELWGHEALRRADRAALDRDPQAVRAVVAGVEPSGQPGAVRARLLAFDGLAAGELGSPAEGAARLEAALKALEEAGDEAVGERLATHLRLHRARLLLQAGGAEAREALPILQGLEPRRALLPGFEVLMVRALLAADRPRLAVERLKGLKVERDTELWPERDELLYLEGLAAWRSGDRAAAHKVFTEFALRFPASPRMGAVLPHLELKLSDQDRLRLAAGFLDARDYRGAVSALEPVASRSGPLQHEARYKLGYVYYRLQRTDREAGIALLQQVADARGARSADATVLLARAWMRTDDYATALGVWRRFRTRFPRDPRADEAAYYHGWLPLDHGRWDEAVAGFEACLEAFPRSGRAQSAWWFQGWAHWRAGRPAQAIASWQGALRAAGSDWLDTTQSLYWLARAHQAAGQSGAAKSLRERLEDNHPWSYYGELQALREKSRPLLPPLVAGAEAVEPEVAWSALDSQPPRTRDAVRVVRDLLHLGLFEEARRRAGPALRQELVEAGGLPREELAFFLSEEVGEVRGGYIEASRRGGALRQAPDAESAPTWRRIYPRPYRRVVEHEARRRGISPLLVWAIMQKESGYDPNALSYADAMGLMQIIPKTGHRIAAELGEVYREGMLFDPHNNIAYAAWYLSELMRKFDGQVALAAAAYNGGPLAVARWVKEDATGPTPLEFDAFVEEIAYDQARTYARKVLTILLRYIIVYAPPAGRGDALLDGLFPPDLRVRPAVLDNIDF